MKKIIVILTAILCLLSCSTVAHAVETGADDLTMDVLASYVRHHAWDRIPVKEDGTAETALRDGTKMKFNGIENTDWYLVVMSIDGDEEAALDWIQNLMKGRAENYSTYYIFLTDDSGNIYSAKDVTVSLSPAEAISNPVVYCAGDEKAKILNVNIAEETLTFIANESFFYMVGEKTGSSTSDSRPPQTGDTTALRGWMLSAAGSLCLLIGLRMKTEKSKK